MGFDFSADYVLNDVCHATTKEQRYSGKGEILVRCPVVPEEEFEMNLEAGGLWCCFQGCACCPVDNKRLVTSLSNCEISTNGGGILDLYRLFFDCPSRKQAFKEINERFTNAGSPEDKSAKRQRTRPAEPAIAPNERLHQVYSAFLDCLEFSEDHRQNIYERVGGQSTYTDIVIERMGFKSTPQGDYPSIVCKLMEQGLDLTDVPGFYQRNGKPSMRVYPTGYFIPYRVDGKIVRLQFRSDEKITDDMSEAQKKEIKRKRYRWYSSVGRTGGTPASSVPFCGVPGQVIGDTVYITEGGLKATIAHILSLRPYFAVTSINMYDDFVHLLQYITRFKSVKNIVTAWDSDRKWNPGVKYGSEKMQQIAESMGITLISSDWGTEQKGCDDYLLALKKKALI